MRHPPSVPARAEDGEPVFGRAERFDTFVGLLTVIKARGHTMNGEVGGADEGWGGPLGSFDAVVGFDVAIHFKERVNPSCSGPDCMLKYLHVPEIQYPSNLEYFSCG